MARQYRITSRAGRDLRWFRAYFRAYSEVSEKKALQRLHEVFSLLANHPAMGAKIAGGPSRKFSIPGMDWTAVYRVENDALAIVRLLDQRSEHYLNELIDEYE